MHKKMNNEEFNNIAQKIKTEIDSAQTILLCCHPSPDPDSLGSVLALKHYLEGIGKKVIALRGDDDLPKNLLTLPGAKNIIAKNFTEIDAVDYDLFIATDSSSPGQVTKLGDIPQPVRKKTIVIDHHDTNTEYGDINLLITDSPATAQIIFELFNNWNVTVNPDIAKCLFAGIYSDTGGFKYPKTTAQTFAIASELAKTAPDFAKIIFDLENNYDAENLKFLGLALSLIENYFSDNVAISPIPIIKMNELGIKKVHTDKMEISNLLKSVTDWNIGASLIERTNGTTSLSLRTRDALSWDVSKIAKALGGGGHTAAAGATISKPLLEAKELFLSVIENLFPELGKR